MRPWVSYNPYKIKDLGTKLFFFRILRTLTSWTYWFIGKNRASLPLTQTFSSTLSIKRMLPLSFLGCECNSVGSVSHVCDKDSGNCTCKSKYAGRTCNQCEAGYYNYPTCKREYRNNLYWVPNIFQLYVT